MAYMQLVARDIERKRKDVGAGRPLRVYADYDGDPVIHRQAVALYQSETGDTDVAFDGYWVCFGDMPWCVDVGPF